jgi:myo-inositol-1(or 4)-monophosphatase
MTQTSILEFAKTFAQEAGELAQSLRRDAATDFVATKGDMDFVTHADRRVESLIRQRLAETFPNDHVLGEEEGGELAETFWIIDPIDGTTNYLKGMPDWGVCLARIDRGVITHGVIACPDHNFLASAEAGQGAHLNGDVLSSKSDRSITLAHVGYSTRISLDEHLDQLRRLIEQGVDYRRSGAACIGLLSVATGMTDMYFEKHLNLWDAAAGVLILAEAGGLSVHDDMAQFAQNGSHLLAMGPGTRADQTLWTSFFDIAG